MSKMLLFLLPMLIGLSAFGPVAAQNITVRGKDFYRDGKPWLPKRIKVEAFSRPAFIPSAPKWMNDPSGRKTWTGEQLSAIKTVFGATVVRFTVSQPALDPQSSIYDPKYRDELLTIFQQTQPLWLSPRWTRRPRTAFPTCPAYPMTARFGRGRRSLPPSPTIPA